MARIGLRHIILHIFAFLLLPVAVVLVHVPAKEENLKIERKKYFLQTYNGTFTWATDYKDNMKSFLLFILPEKICGKALRGISERADLKEIGVKTMRRRILLLEEINNLLGSTPSSINSKG